MRSRSIARDVADMIADRQSLRDVLRGGDPITSVGAEEIRPRFQPILVDRLGVARVEVLDGEFLLDISSHAHMFAVRFPETAHCRLGDAALFRGGPLPPISTTEQLVAALPGCRAARSRSRHRPPWR